MIPVQEPPEDKIVKSNLPKYREMKQELLNSMSWTKKKENNQ